MNKNTIRFEEPWIGKRIKNFSDVVNLARYCLTNLHRFEVEQAIVVRINQ